MLLFPCFLLCDGCVRLYRGTEGDMVGLTGVGDGIYDCMGTYH